MPAGMAGSGFPHGVDAARARIEALGAVAIGVQGVVWALLVGVAVGQGVICRAIGLIAVGRLGLAGVWPGLIEQQADASVGVISVPVALGIGPRAGARLVVGHRDARPEGVVGVGLGRRGRPRALVDLRGYVWAEPEVGEGGRARRVGAVGLGLALDPIERVVVIARVVVLGPVEAPRAEALEAVEIAVAVEGEQVARGRARAELAVGLGSRASSFETSCGAGGDANISAESWPQVRTGVRGPII